MLNKLNELNDVEIIDVHSHSFLPYGRVVSGYDFSEVIGYMKENTAVPEKGNIYFPSIAQMEDTAVKARIQNTLYGGMPVQIGYCNGRNTTYNGFEYHKGSEINIAVTAFMLVLGHTYDIKENHYDIKDAQVFFVPEGTAVEMYQTTLHLSPCAVCDGGFRDIVILPRGTNTPLESSEKNADSESLLLLQKNKWVIAHPEREPLIRQGAFAGVTGENKELFYK